MEQVTTPFLEYGVIGALCVLLLFAVRYLFKKSEENSAIWQDIAINSQKSFVAISLKQNETNQKLIEIRERDVDQAKHFHVEISKKMEDMPARILKEIEYRKLHDNQLNSKNHVTPAT